MRYTCTLAGYEDCWIDLDDQWTRGEARAYVVGPGDEARLNAAARKTIGLHLVSGETVIAKPADLTLNNLDKLPFQLATWFDQAVIRKIEAVHEASETAAKAWLDKAKEQPAPLDHKYVCTFPGFEDCYIQMGEDWLRGDMTMFEQVGGQAFIDLVRPKLVSLSIGSIDTPEKFTLEATEQLDYVIWRWLITALQRGKDDLQKMGEANARRSLRASGN